MIPQYVAASLVCENKVLVPSGAVDSIPTSAGQEDHVSMGNAAGLKAWQVLANSESALAIELLAGAQAVEFLAPLEPAGRRGVRRRLSRAAGGSADRALGRRDCSRRGRDAAMKLRATSRRCRPATSATGRIVLARPRVGDGRCGGAALERRRADSVTRLAASSSRCAATSRRSARRAGTELNARAWPTEAPLRMLLNNLDREVAERPEELIVYGGSGKAARNHEACARSSRSLLELGAGRDAARPVRQAGRRLHDARRRAARADRERAARAALGDLGRVPAARGARA